MNVNTVSTNIWDLRVSPFASSFLKKALWVLLQNPSIHSTYHFSMSPALLTIANIFFPPSMKKQGLLPFHLSQKLSTNTAAMNLMKVIREGGIIAAIFLFQQFCFNREWESRNSNSTWIYVVLSMFKQYRVQNFALFCDIWVAFGCNLSLDNAGQKEASMVHSKK